VVDKLLLALFHSLIPLIIGGVVITTGVITGVVIITGVITGVVIITCVVITPIGIITTGVIITAIDHYI